MGTESGRAALLRPLDADHPAAHQGQQNSNADAQHGQLPQSIETVKQLLTPYISSMVCTSGLQDSSVISLGWDWLLGSRR